MTAPYATAPPHPARSVDQQLSALGRLVGNTPLLGIRYAFRGRPGILYAKCEQMNLTGSIKDRMALYILQKAYEQGKVLPGDMIVEASSGNTGIAFSAIDPDSIKPMIQAGIEQKINFITLDSDAPDTGRLIYIGTNNYKAGVAAANIQLTSGT